jgi:hypothetical protein
MNQYIYNILKKRGMYNKVYPLNYSYLNIQNRLENIISIYKEKKNINLIVSYYNDKNLDRCKEIKLCLKLNCMNQLFNKIIIINETCKNLYFIKKNESIIIINNSNRLTYKNFFNYANMYSNEDTINILINSDIVIGEGFDKINLNKNEVYFLTRYNISLDGTFNFQDDNGSFDTWIWKGIINNNIYIGNYYLGIPECDIKIAYEFYISKYKIKNPSLDLKTYHVHNTEIRNYNTSFVSKDISKQKKNNLLKIKFSNLDTPFTENDYIFI